MFQGYIDWIKSFSTKDLILSGILFLLYFVFDIGSLSFYGSWLNNHSFYMYHWNYITEMFNKNAGQVKMMAVIVIVLLLISLYSAITHLVSVFGLVKKNIDFTQSWIIYSLYPLVIFLAGSVYLIIITLTSDVCTTVEGLYIVNNTNEEYIDPSKIASLAESGLKWCSHSYEYIVTWVVFALIMTIITIISVGCCSLDEGEQVADDQNEE